jgi:enoyl-[acyl-carrier protein] reductase I
LSASTSSRRAGPAPAREVQDVGNLAAFVVGDGASALTGNIEYVDAGYHIIG